MENYKFGIGILNWNGSDATVDLLSDLRKQKDINLEVVVIDNGSRKQGEVETLEKNIGDYSLLLNDKNIGVAAGFNQEIKFLLSRGCDYICLLNNDTRINDEYFFSKILKDFVQYGNKSIITPLITYMDDNSPWYNHGFYNDLMGLQVPAARNNLLNKLTIFVLSGSWPNNEYFKNMKGVMPAGEFISGCGMTFHKSIVEDIGLFDENLFAYCEDLDFSQRALKKGYKLLIDYSTVLSHIRSLTSAKKNSHGNSRLHIYMWSRNFMYYSRKQLSLLKFILFLFFRPLVGFYWFMKANDKKNFLFDFIKGNIDGFTGRLRKKEYFS